MSLPSFIIVLCSFFGLSLSVFIYIKKRRKKTLVCPIGHSCDPVVHSDYSRFMGIPVEILGILYYLLILVSYSAFLAYPSIKTGEVGSALLIISALAFLFSGYLTLVQAFVLKEWCTWCLISATLCTIIFFAALQLSGFEITTVVGELGILR